jgi:hypothetical protein
MPQGPDRILALWVPGHDPEPLEGGVGLRLPANAEIGVRILYKKPWQLEGHPVSDRSTVGIYFAAASDAQELLAVPVSTSREPKAGADGNVTFERTLDRDVQLLAIRPDGLPPNISVQVTGVLPDGTQVPIIRLKTRPDWVRRYWMDRPLTLPRGSKIEVAANLANPDRLLDPSAPATALPPALSLALDVVAVPAGSPAPLPH